MESCLWAGLPRVSLQFKGGFMEREHVLSHSFSCSNIKGSWLNLYLGSKTRHLTLKMGIGESLGMRDANASGYEDVERPTKGKISWRFLGRCKSRDWLNGPRDRAGQTCLMLSRPKHLTDFKGKWIWNLLFSQLTPLCPLYCLNL